MPERRFLTIHCTLGNMNYWKLLVTVLSVHQISCPTFDTMATEHKLLTLSEIIARFLALCSFARILPRISLDHFYF